MDQTPKKPELNKYIGLIFVLILTVPQLIIPVLVIAGVLVAAKKLTATQEETPQSTATASQPLDDCPKKLFCFHKDKGEHHVRRGKEMDPWDRPDIDIRKYQRKD